MMPKSRMDDALDQAIKMGVKSVKPNFRGEPALSKNLINFVRKAKKGGIVDIFMNTNGIPYTAEKIRELKKAGMTRVKVSIDGATRKTYESIRLGSDAQRWPKLMKNIKTFQEEGPPLELQMTTTQSNEGEVDAFKEKFPGLKLHINKERQILTERQHCPQPYRRMIVAHDGKVFGCCQSWWDEFPIGHIDKQPLRDIWNGEKMQELRKHAKDYTGPCTNCTIREAWKR